MSILMHVVVAVAVTLVVSWVVAMVQHVHGPDEEC